jgi:integrase
MTVVERTRKDGSTAYKVKVWSPAEEREVWVGTFDTERDALNAEKDAHDAARTGNKIVPTRVSSPTLSEVVKSWKESPNYVRAKASTQADYDGAAKKISAARIGSLKIGEIGEDEITAFEKTLRTAPHHADNTVRKAIIRLKQILRWARRRGMDVRQEALDYSPPRAPRVPHSHSPINEEWLPIILAKVDPMYRVLILLVCGSGLRRNEVLALKFQDLHWNDGAPIIKCQYALNNGELVKPKTSWSVRDVPIAVDLYQLVQAYASSRPGRRTDFIFVTPEKGRPWTDTYFSRVFRDQIRKAGFSKHAGDTQVRLHMFRHFYAALCLREGMNVMELSRNLGHHDPGFTLSVYGHLLPSNS